MNNKYGDLLRMADQLELEISQNYHEYIKSIQKENMDDDHGVNYLIMPIGLNPEPAIVTLTLTRPKKILFLYTKESMKVVDQINEAIHLKPEEFLKAEVEDSEPLKIYQLINDCYHNWGKPQEVYIDITGGTKAMSVATAMAGITIDAKLLYLSSNKYIQSIHRPKIGEEKLIKLDNPIKAFGDVDEDIALDHMESYDYLSATEIFKQLISKVPDGNRKMYCKILYLLSSGYEFWDNLEFKEAYQNFNEMINLIESIKKYNESCVMADKLEQLKLQAGILNVLANEFNNRVNEDILRDIDNVLALLMTIYRSAKRRKYQEKYDMAILLLYRMIEVISQRRLEQNGVNYEDPEFHRVLGEEKYMHLKIMYSKFKNAVFQDQRTYKLPKWHITLIDGYFILASLDDRLFHKVDKKEFLYSLYSFCRLRNKSIFAHGFKVITQEEYDAFESFAESLLKNFCKIEKIDLKHYQDKVKFINPENTMYIK